MQTALDGITVELAKAAQAKTLPQQQQHLYETNNLLTECFIWNDKARRRKLLEKEDYQAIYIKLSKLQKLLCLDQKN